MTCAVCISSATIYLHQNKFDTAMTMASTASVASGASNASHTICMISYPLNLLLETFQTTSSCATCISSATMKIKLPLQCQIAGTASEASQAFNAICAQ